MVELNFSIGDQVRLRLALNELDGRILESPDSSLVMLKLSSGYNVGIPKENILASRVLKKFSEEKKSFEIKNNPKLPKIAVVITGGTIASKLDAKTGGVKPLTDIKEFLQFHPEMLDIVSIKKIEVPFMIASESMSPENWIKIAKVTKALLDDPEIQGVIITHGTDTLHYTSAALSFFLKDLTKPVVLTYSQRSIDRASSDASLNLQCAARMAISDVSEVMIVGHATTNDDFCFAHRGTKVRKMHSSRRDAFHSINAPPIAKVWPDKVEILSPYKKRTKGKTELDVDFTDKIALIKIFPGQDPSVLDFYSLKNKGIIIEATGMGHVPTGESSNDWLPKIRKHIREGLTICVTTQCVNGRVDPFVYSSGRELLDSGAIFLEDMLAETAFVKLGWVLGHHGWKKFAKEKMLENMIGELNEKLTN